PSPSAPRVEIRRAKFRRNDDAIDAAVPVDTQNAPTRPWKLHNSFHSADSAHLLFEKDPTQTEESRSVNLVLGFHRKIDDSRIEPVRRKRAFAGFSNPSAICSNYS